MVKGIKSGWITEKTEQTVLTYDLPSPDGWSMRYEVTLRIPRDAIFKWINEYILASDPKRGLAWLLSDEDAKIQKMLPADQGFYSQMVSSLLSDDRKGMCVIKCHGNVITNEPDFTQIYTELKRFLLQQRPEIVAGLKGWIEKGEMNVNSLSWDFVEKVFYETDIIDNWKYDPTAASETPDTDPSQPVAPVKGIFESTRMGFSKQAKKVFRRIAESVFLVPSVRALAPNDLNEAGVGIYNKEKPPASYEYEFDPAGETPLARNKFALMTAVRDPRQPLAETTLMELIVSHFLPPYSILEDYMRKEDGSFRQRFLKYRYTFDEGFDSWVFPMRFVAPDTEAFEGVRKFLTKIATSTETDKLGNIETDLDEIQALIATKEAADKVMADPKSRPKVVKTFNSVKNEYELFLLDYESNAKYRDTDNINMTIETLKSLGREIESGEEPTADQLVDFLDDEGWFYSIPLSILATEDEEKKGIYQEDKTTREARKKIEAKMNAVYEIIVAHPPPSRIKKPKKEETAAEVKKEVVETVKKEEKPIESPKPKTEPAEPPVVSKKTSTKAKSK